MAYISREQVTADFQRRIGLAPYTPVSNTAFTAVMADPESCLAERTQAWTFARAWGNASECAVSDWQPGRAQPLDQVDCALDLFFLEQGKTWKWVTDLTPAERQAARSRLKVTEKRNQEGSIDQVSVTEFRNYSFDQVLPKSRLSEAFRKNQERGTVEIKGRKIYPVVAPVKREEPPRLRKSVTKGSVFRITDEFGEWLQANRPEEYSVLLEAKKVFESCNHDFRETVTPAQCNLIDEKEEKKSSSSRGSLAAGAEPPPSTTTTADYAIEAEQTEAKAPEGEEAPAVLEARVSAGSAGQGFYRVRSAPTDTGEHKQEVDAALSRYVVTDAAAAPFVLRECRKADKDATTHEIVHFVHECGPKVRKDARSPLGYLMDSVINCFPNKARALRASLSQEKAPDLSHVTYACDPPDLVVKTSRCRECRGMATEYASGAIDPCRCGRPPSCT